MSVQNIPAEQQPFLYASGCQITNDATTPNTKLDVAIGQVRDSNDVLDIVLTTALVIDATVNGFNGLDTGALAASKVYAAYLIADSTNNHPVGAILTLASNTAPLMPFGYDSYRLIGFAVTDSSVHFLKMYVSGIGSGRQLLFDAPQATAITAGNATSYTAIDLSAIVPPVNNIPVNIFSALTPSAAGRGVFLQPANATADAIVNLGQVTSVVLNSYNVLFAQLVTSLSKINYKVSNASDAVAIKVAGFTFTI